MNSPCCETATPYSPTALTLNRLVLVIKDKGPVPSFKNRKRIVHRKNRKPRLITDPKVKKWMEQARIAIESQCIYASLTGDDETQTVASRRCWIASFLPADDCWTLIPEISLKCELVEPGQEGATIIIEKL